MSFRIVKGDEVKVISGDNKGETGKVIAVDAKNSKIKVEGIKVVKKHQKPSNRNPQGGIIEKEAFIHASNVMIVDRKTSVPTRIGSKLLADGKKVRISTKSKEQLD
jgi:large subunit ribosomal protein L24